MFKNKIQEWEEKQARRLAAAEAEYDQAVKAKGEAQRLATEAAKKPLTLVDKELVEKRVADANARYKLGEIDTNLSWAPTEFAIYKFRP